MTVVPFLGNIFPIMETNSSREMLARLDEVSVSRPEDQNELSCEWCSDKAEIFQATGDYCLQCWQEETHPNV